uniref:Uncharacterized protein n=1 Tax=Trichuris muris TaxID=70415 RepID=A0A5S6QCE8_TRIMR
MMNQKNLIAPEPPDKRSKRLEWTTAAVGLKRLKLGTFAHFWEKLGEDKRFDDGKIPERSQTLQALTECSENRKEAPSRSNPAAWSARRQHDCRIAISPLNKPACLSLKQSNMYDHGEASQRADRQRTVREGATAGRRARQLRWAPNGGQPNAKQRTVDVPSRSRALYATFKSRTAAGKSGTNGNLANEHSVRPTAAASFARRTYTIGKIAAHLLKLSEALLTTMARMERL